MNDGQWFYVEAGAQRGPHTAREVRDALRRLGRGTLVWREGMAEWLPADRVPELTLAPPRRPAGGGDDEPTLNPLVLWRRCFAWGGRFNRLEFAIAHLGFSFLGVLLFGTLALLVGAVAEEGEDWPAVAVGGVALVWILLSLVVSLGAMVRRLHDLGQTPWLALLTFLPCLNLVLLIYLLAAPGQAGPAPAPTGAALAVGIAVAVVVLAVPMFGIIAAIAIPSLLRARVSANEASAIGGVRTVITAQAAYQFANGGAYDARWECLVGPGECIPGYTGASFLDRGVFGGPRSGYTFELSGGARAEGASASSTDTFVVTARPLQPGQTGVRSFCGDASGRVCALPGGSLLDLVRGAPGEAGLQCSAACQDLR